MSEYSVYLDEKSVGKALFTKEGMYQRVRCDCKVPKDQCYHAFIKTTEGHVPLGILVPTANGMGTEKRIHTKIMTGDVVCLCVFAKNSSSGGIPVEPDKPFPYISKIREMKVMKQAQTGQIVLDAI